MPNRRRGNQTVRIYDGASRPLLGDACPACGRQVSIGSTGRRRRHVDGRGDPCLAGGVTVGVRPVHVEHPGIVLPPERSRSGQGQRARELGEPQCGTCGRNPGINRDGSVRAHRVRADDPCAPYCAASHPIRHSGN